MATFTIRVHELRQQGFDFGLTKDPEQGYQIYDENLRGILDENGKWQYNVVNTPNGGQEFFGLNKFILDHFEFHEIGCESEDLFRFRLNTRMREIMPYYNQLLASAALVFDPFQTLNTDHATTSAENMVDAATNTNDNNNTSVADTKARAVTSIMPQTMLSNNADYASNATDNNGQNTSDTTGHATGAANREVNSDGTTTVHSTGSQGHTAALLMQYRRSFLNISMMIVNELQDQFFMIMENNDSSHGRNDYYGPFGLGVPYFQSGF